MTTTKTSPKRHIRTLHSNPIRRPLRAGGETLCGATPSRMDIHFIDGCKSWVFKPAAVKSGVDAIPCDECRAVHESAKGKAPEHSCRKHVWARCDYDADSVDNFAYSEGYHNGPRCVVCDYAYCTHCWDVEPDQDCPGFNVADRIKGLTRLAIAITEIRAVAIDCDIGEALLDKMTELRELLNLPAQTDCAK